MKNQQLKNFVEFNLAMIFMATSGPLGRAVAMPPEVTIAWRCTLAVFFLLAYIKFKNIPLAIDWKTDGREVILGGVLMGIHWVTYFYALQLSNVAIGMLTLFTYPVISSFLEPILLKTKFQKIHLLLATMVLIGVYFLVPNFSLQDDTTKAVGFGVFSALLYSIRNIIMKKKVAKYHGTTLMWYQVVIVALMLLPVLILHQGGAILHHWKPVLALGLMTTTIGHTMFLISFKNFSITTASIMSSVQPVYGILLGMLFLNEIPEWSTIIGGVLIITTVIIESVRTYR